MALCCSHRNSKTAAYSTPSATKMTCTNQVELVHLVPTTVDDELYESVCSSFARLRIASQTTKDLHLHSSSQTTALECTRFGLHLQRRRQRLKTLKQKTLVNSKQSFFACLVLSADHLSANCFSFQFISSTANSSTVFLPSVIS